MDKLINEEINNILCGKVPNNLHRDSALKKVEHNSPFLKCELHTVTSFQRGDGKEGNNLTVETPEKHCLSQVIKFKVNSDKPC